MDKVGGKKEKMRQSLSISSLSLYFLPLYPLPVSKIVSFCRKMLNTALLSQMSQKNLHTCYEKIILGRIRCEKALQVVRACSESTIMCEKPVGRYPTRQGLEILAYKG